MRHEIQRRRKEHARPGWVVAATAAENRQRSEEHTSELQSRLHLVCRLLLEKKQTFNGLSVRCYKIRDWCGLFIIVPMHLLAAQLKVNTHRESQTQRESLKHSYHDCRSERPA